MPASVQGSLEETTVGVGGRKQRYESESDLCPGKN